MASRESSRTLGMLDRCYACEPSDVEEGFCSPAASEDSGLATLELNSIASNSELVDNDAENVLPANAAATRSSCKGARFGVLVCIVCLLRSRVVHR